MSQDSIAPQKVHLASSRKLISCSTFLAKFGRFLPRCPNFLSSGRHYLPQRSSQLSPGKRRHILMKQFLKQSFTVHSSRQAGLASSIRSSATSAGDWWHIWRRRLKEFEKHVRGKVKQILGECSAGTGKWENIGTLLNIWFLCVWHALFPTPNVIVTGKLSIFYKIQTKGVTCLVVRVRELDELHPPWNSWVSKTFPGKSWFLPRKG